MHKSCEYIVEKALSGDKDSVNFITTCSSKFGCSSWNECSSKICSHKGFKPSITITRRQKEVLISMCRSKGSNKHIARELGISESTVKIHMSRLMKRMNVNNRTQAILEAKKLGLI